MSRSLLVLSALVAAVAARTSPHADQVSQDGARYSNSIYEDARLDVPDLITKYGYPAEAHEVTTSDGYVLEIHRIPHGRVNQDANRPVVFLMHGLLSSSADWVNMGPSKGFGYILADEGFDVWMGNARGNYYSRRHLTLEPDSRNFDFWDFSWHEIGNIDLAACIDYVLDRTNRSGLHYVGHSQGTTSFFVMASTRPEYNDKILSMHAFAPVAYMSNSENRLFNYLAPYASEIQKLSSMIGFGEFLPNNELMTLAGTLCRDSFPFHQMCSNVFFLIGGSNEDQFNATMIPVKLGHTPAGASVKQFAHYGQGIVSGMFRQYDHGIFKNRRLYGRFTPPAYNLGRITAPVCLHYSEADPLAHVLDVDQLYRELGNPFGKFKVPDPNFSHIDFLWGIDARELLYDNVISLIRTLDRH